MCLGMYTYIYIYVFITDASGCMHTELETLCCLFAFLGVHFCKIGMSNVFGCFFCEQRTQSCCWNPLWCSWIRDQLVPIIDKWKSAGSLNNSDR